MKKKESTIQPLDATSLAMYLQRIGLQHKISIDTHGLNALHHGQLRNIPFENFDVIAGREIELNHEALIDKLVQQKRGGYCFELNGLMTRVLVTLGFKVNPLLGRVHLLTEPTGRAHYVNLVTLHGQDWLVDVGFGAKTPRAPLPLQVNIEHTTDRQTFRFIADEDFGIMLQIKTKADWHDLYSLDMTHVCQGDIDQGNHYTSTNKNSVFTNNCIAALATEDGTNTLENNRLKIARHGKFQSKIIRGEQDYRQTLKDHFGIELDVDYERINDHLT